MMVLISLPFSTARIWVISAGTTPWSTLSPMEATMTAYIVLPPKPLPRVNMPIISKMALTPK